MRSYTSVFNSTASGVALGRGRGDGDNDDEVGAADTFQERVSRSTALLLRMKAACRQLGILGDSPI